MVSTKRFRLPAAIVGLLTILALIEITPYFVTAAFPNLCYGCTFLGDLHQTLNSKIKLTYINWAAYLLLFVYFIYLSSQWKPSILKYLVIGASLFMIYIPIYPILNIITFILQFVYRNPPFLRNRREVRLLWKQKICRFDKVEVKRTVQLVHGSAAASVLPLLFLR